MFLLINGLAIYWLTWTCDDVLGPVCTFSFWGVLCDRVDVQLFLKSFNFLLQWPLMFSDLRIFWHLREFSELEYFPIWTFLLLYFYRWIPVRVISNHDFKLFTEDLLTPNGIPIEPVKWGMRYLPTRRYEGFFFDPQPWRAVPTRGPYSKKWIHDEIKMKENENTNALRSG